MARDKEINFPSWSPQMGTRSKFESESFQIRYKALRNSSGAFIKRADVKEAVLEKYGHRCAICGAAEGLQIDHIISVYRCAKGEFPVNELNKLDNLQPLCAECNARKAP